MVLFHPHQILLGCLPRCVCRSPRLLSFVSFPLTTIFASDSAVSSAQRSAALLRSISKEVDVDEFVFTLDVVVNTLLKIQQTLHPNYALQQKLKGLNATLDSFERWLATSSRNRLVDNLASSRRRPKLAQETLRIQTDLHLVVDAAGVLAEGTGSLDGDDGLKQRLAESFSSDDVRKLWMTLFDCDQSVSAVAWDTFLAAYEKAVDRKMSPDEENTIKHVLDSDCIGGVTARSFNNFLKIFGPLEKSFKNVKNLFKQKWFHGFLTVEEVIRLLSDQPVGTFLVRFSRSKPDSFVVEFVEEKGKIHTTFVANDMPHGVRILEAAGKEKVFPSISALVDHYSSTMKHPFVSDFLTQPWFFGDTSKAEATELLRHSPIGTFMIRFSDSERFVFSLSYVVADETLPDHPMATEVKHLDIFKVPNGFSIGAEHAPSTSSASSSSVIRKIEAENGRVVYASFSKLISEWRHVLRFNFNSERVPSIRLADYGEAPDLVDLVGPGTTAGAGSRSGFGPADSLVCAECTVTYPKGSYPWQVVCDQYAIRVLGNRILFAVADGCGPGKSSREAAVRACRAILDRLGNKTLQTSLWDTADIKRVLLRSFSYAHDAIILDDDAAGTTTLCAGMIVPLETHSEDPEYGVVFANVGDCKAYIWNAETKAVVDLTSGNRTNLRDPKDPGGRLGPFIGSGPDLRNLSSGFWPLRQGDVFFVCTDGVHDNFDPESLGITPAAASKRIKKHPLATKEIRAAGKTAAGSWDSVPHDKIEPLKVLFQTELLKDIITSSGAITAASIVSACVQNAIQTTAPSRNWMEADPRNNEPADHVAYPGKMDHTTIVALQGAAYFPKARLRMFKSTAVAPVADFSSAVVSAATTHPSSSTSPRQSSSSTSFVGPCEKLKDKLLLNMPRVEIAPYNSSEYVKLLMGPMAANEGELKLGSMASGWTTSTLPSARLPDGTRQRIGDPNNNVYAAELSRTRITLVLTSSTVWGQLASSATSAAAQTFLDTISRLQATTGSISDAKISSLKAFDAAHQQLISMGKPEAKVTSGILSALIMREADSKKWTILVTSVGNSKLLVWRKSDKSVRDLTRHSTPADSNDTGGRLGDYADGGAPDLRNLSMYSSQLEEGDIVFALSPAAQNNFEPDILGETVQDLDDLADLGNQTTWSSLLQSNPQRLVDAKDNYRCTMLSDAFSEFGDNVDPTKVSQVVVQHCIEKTKKTRKFLEENPYAATPTDFATFPGKLGHSTCLAVRVGTIPKAELQQNTLLPTVAAPLFQTS